jgi:CheY-like chemotaxis protein
MKNLNISDAEILIVDDNAQNVQILGKMLSQHYSNIEFAVDGKSALEWINNKKFDIILLDIMLPDINGIEICKMTRKSGLNDDIPIIFLSADNDKQTILQGFEAGGQDYITKPFDNMEMLARVQTHLLLRKSVLEVKELNETLEEKVKLRTLELEKALAKADASDKLKSAFIGNISHEVRTPLNGILGFASLLAKGSIPDDKKELFLDLVNQSGERLIKTITDYMDISLLVSGNIKAEDSEFNPVKLLQNFYTKYKPLCENKGLTFDFIYPPELTELTIFSDNSLFEKTIEQLIDNALKFTYTGEVKLELNFNDSYLICSVQDTGIGIKPEIYDWLFKPFNPGEASLVRSYEGSGLGLAIAKGFVNLLAGEISFTSEAGKGTAFQVKIPANRAVINVVTSDTIAGSSQNKELHNPVVLVAEDDEANFLYAKELLRRLKIEVIHASNGKEAVDICKNTGKIDLILMDLKMPVIDGYEATRQIKSIREDIPVVALTAYALKVDELKAKEAGCTEFAIKPVSEATLKKIINNVLPGFEHS